MCSTFNNSVNVDKTNCDSLVGLTGYKKAITDPSYLSINCLFNDTNYWLNLRGRALKRSASRTLDLSNQSVWLKLVQDLYKPQKANSQPKVTLT